MASSSLISVLLPVKNGGRYLRLAVDSILQQSHSNLELIVVDDHSDDGSIDALPRDARIKLATNEGVGVSAANATAAELAQGNYLARMDADDIALPQRLATQLAYLYANPELALCGAEVDIFVDQGALGGGYARYQQWINALRAPDDIANNIYIESPIPNPTVMFRRESYEALSGFGDTEWHEDYDLYLRAHHAGMRMGKPDGILLRWRDHVARSTRNQARYLEAQLLACKAYYLSENELSNRPAVICGTGPVGLALHDALEQRGVEVLGFTDIAMQRIGGQKRGKPVFSYDDVGPGAEVIYLGALGQPAARKGLQQLFDERQMCAARDYLMCA